MVSKLNFIFAGMLMLVLLTSIVAVSAQTTSNTRGEVKTTEDELEVQVDVPKGVNFNIPYEPTIIEIFTDFFTGLGYLLKNPLRIFGAFESPAEGAQFAQLKSSLYQDNKFGISGIFFYDSKGKIRDYHANLGRFNPVEPQKLLVNDWEEKIVAKANRGNAYGIILGDANEVWMNQRILKVLRESRLETSEEEKYLEKAINKLITKTNKRYGPVFKQNVFIVKAPKEDLFQ